MIQGCLNLRMQNRRFQMTDVGLEQPPISVTTVGPGTNSPEDSQGSGILISGHREKTPKNL